MKKYMEDGAEVMELYGKKFYKCLQHPKIEYNSVEAYKLHMEVDHNQQNGRLSRPFRSELQ